MAAVQLHKWLKEFLNILWRDTDPRVPNGKDEGVIYCVAGDVKPDSTLFRRKFDGIAKEVNQHLLKTPFIDIEVASSDIEIEVKFQAFFVRHLGNKAQAALTDR